MKRAIYIILVVGLVIVISCLVYWNLPFEWTRRSDISAGNNLIEGLNSYRSKNNKIPDCNDWPTLKNLGFKAEVLGTTPSYVCNRHGDYELIFTEGFDGPYLMWNSKEKRWKIDFPTIFCEDKSKDSHTDSTDALHKVRGKAVVFLTPSEEKFEKLKNETGIYEVDSDFGFAISRTMEILTTKPEFKNIRTEIYSERFIEILDCKNCPKIMDRDSIYYGLILTDTNKEIRIITNVQALDYEEEIEEYFK